MLDVIVALTIFQNFEKGPTSALDSMKATSAKAINSLSNQNAIFMVGDVSKLDLYGRTFDLVLMADLTHHLDDSAAASF